MKLFPSGHATHPQWRMAAALALAQLRAQMALPAYASAPTLGLLYITDHYAAEAQALLDHLSAELPEVTDWSGTVGVGVAANNAEYFDEPALSVMLLDVPAHRYRIFSGVAPLPSLAAQQAGAFTAHTALVHADGQTPELVGLIEEMAARTSGGYLFGGLAASRGTSVQFAVGGNGNMAGQGAATGVFGGGLSGVAFGPGVGLVSRVTQGCQPVGPLHTITAAQDNVVLALDGEPALDVLLDTLEVALDGDPQPAPRVAAEHRDPQRAGRAAGGLPGHPLTHQDVPDRPGVRPAVEQDGGNITFRSYKDGVVTVNLQGSCSGCPSATVTLKAGIENLLKRMVPEVKEVVAQSK